MIIRLLIFICFASSAMAEPVALSGKITDEQGHPVRSAAISIANTTHRSDESGNFSIDTSAIDTSVRDIYQLHIAARGYYSFIHTFSRADVLASDTGQMILAIPPIALVQQKKNRRLLVFGGDTMMGRRFVVPPAGEPALVRAATAAADTRSIVRQIRPYLGLADFASVNLETQLSDGVLSDRLAKSVTFYSTSELAHALKWAGVDYVALGNNHMFDYRDTGLERTFRALGNAGLGYSGAGASDAAARRPYTTTVRGQRIDMLSYVGWAGSFEPNQVAAANKGGAALGTGTAISEDLASIRKDSLTILQYHSGLEYVSQPPLAEETQLKLAIDNGADIAIGHHSHVYQGVEIYKGKLVAYSLGNFVFDQYLYSTQSAILLFAWYDGDDLHRAEIVPVHINGYVPTPATGAIRYDTLQRLVRLSDSASVCWSRSGGHAALQPCTADVGTGKPQTLRLARQTSGVSDSLLSLRAHNVDPLRPIQAIQATKPYRLGLDILRRGDFEYVGLFGTTDRSWIDDERISFPSVKSISLDSMMKESMIKDSPSPESTVMNISVAPREKVSAGMKVFTRVFSRSNPATVSVSSRTSGCAKFRFYLQRRPDQMSFSDALGGGPITAIGEFTATSKNWTAFELGFNLPRIATRGIRLLFDVENCSDDGSPMDVQIDDLALIEWQTPWYSDGKPIQSANRVQATHLQYRSAD